jgi:hypothetical protein
MAEIKTVPTDLSIEKWLETLKPDKKKDAKELIRMMMEITGEKPVIWGTNMVGFGSTNLKYASGREINYFLIGFGMRKKAITIYLSIEVNKKVFEELGKHTKGVGCLYINQLSDVNQDELKKIMIESVNQIKALS